MFHFLKQALKRKFRPVTSQNSTDIFCCQATHHLCFMVRECVFVFAYKLSVQKSIDSKDKP